MKITRILLVMAAGTVLVSCASIFSKSKILLTNDSVNEPVNITTDKAHYENVFLPAKVKIKKGYGTSSIMVTSRNYQPLNLTVDKKFNAAYIANVFFPIGFIIDAATGAIMKPAKKAYYLNLKPKNENNQNIIIYNEVPTPQIADSGRDGAVSRDNPGQTELEQTIIRWNIDSEPQGARIYWRVVSNVPAEVKNTNELYLGPTPYEETRPFNILGLTYENSHNVQIEIKLSRRGYMDQIKRFNVRQAIDQQEISTFFELVPEETE